MPKLGGAIRRFSMKVSNRWVVGRVGRKLQSARVAQVTNVSDVTDAEVTRRLNATRESERGLDSIAHPRDSSRYSP
jgi:hypothetical protein